MALVAFLLPNGESKIVDSGSRLATLMDVGRRANIPGIIGDCGGFMACATCHVYVEPEWRDSVGPPSKEEEDLLALTDEVRPESRLSCQIWLTQDLNGLRVRPAKA